MNKYETIIIINPNIESESIESIIENIQNLISDNQGQMTKIDRWGKKRLAYEVKGNKEGYYVLADYMAEPQFIQRFSQYCSLTEQIIKYMTVRAEKLPEVRREPFKTEHEEKRYQTVGVEDDDEYEDDFDEYDNDEEYDE